MKNPTENSGVRQQSERTRKSPFCCFPPKTDRNRLGLGIQILRNGIGVQCLLGLDGPASRFVALRNASVQLNLVGFPLKGGQITARSRNEPEDPCADRG